MYKNYSDKIMGVYEIKVRKSALFFIETDK